ncbi:MAG: transcriptional repressor [Candidatus Omnitrophica bacterium]|nr:transcriptional repressor [Candidatus Omnitrophota bacterium]
MQKEIEILQEYIKSKGLRNTPQREAILRVFLSSERHLSADELHKIVQRKDCSIGYTTVYRTMRLLLECGLCAEIAFADGVQRFEHKCGHEHHDHLICIKCGRFIEAVKPQIEKMQEALAREEGFTITHHKLQIFGFCKNCKK